MYAWVRFVAVGICSSVAETTTNSLRCFSELPSVVRQVHDCGRDCGSCDWIGAETDRHRRVGVLTSVPAENLSGGADNEC
jgi:hypothetical protein